MQIQKVSDTRWMLNGNRYRTRGEAEVALQKLLEESKVVVEPIQDEELLQEEALVEEAIQDAVAEEEPEKPKWKFKL